MTKLRNLFLLLVICGCLPAISSGYGKTWMGIDLERQVREAVLKLGPFRLSTMFIFNNAGYDTNVYRTPANPIKDFSLTAGSWFNLYLPVSKKIIFSIYDSPQYVFFLDTDRERTWNNYFTGQVHFAFPRFFVTLQRGYSLAREIWTTELDIRPQRREDSYQGQLFWQPKGKASFLVQIRQASYAYEDLSYHQVSIRAQLNRKESYLSMSSFFQVAARVRFNLTAEYGLYDFENRPTLRNWRSYSLFAGFEFSPLGIIRGRINFGFMNFGAREKGGHDYKGYVGDTNITARPTKSLAVRASYRRGVQFSAWSSNGYFLENRLGGGVSIYLKKNIRIDYDYSAGEISYPSRAETDSDSFKVISQSIGLYFRLIKNTGIGLTVNQWSRESDLNWANGKRTFIGANLISNF